MSEASEIDDLLDRWEDALEGGAPIDLATLCAHRPELLGELQRRVDALEAIDNRLEQTGMHGVTEGPGPNGAMRPVDEAVGDLVVAEGSYRGLRLLARGGLGVVYTGQDEKLHREVAVKFLQRRCSKDEASLRQFMVEAEVTSRLEHPGVVPVYGAGLTEDDRPFYAMRLIQGETLDDAIAEFHGAHDDPEADPAKADDRISPHDASRNLELRSLLTRFVSVCRTIAYAHNRGILHRDIKPANVMLGRYGETLVVDWGLAMAVGREGQFKHELEKTLMPMATSSMTESGSIAGTPAYMSPEQMSGDGTLSPAADIYALGATLYKLLTGRPPVEAPTLAELRQLVIRGEFDPPRRLAPGLSAALEAICLKAMALQPEKRYATAMELGDEVERYLADEPVAAYQEPFTRKVARWARRHRSVVQTAAAAVVSLLVLTTVFSGWQTRTAQRATVARHDGLISRASLAANALGSELDRRMLILDIASRDRELRLALKAAYKDPENREKWMAVNEWLFEQRNYWLEKRGLASYNWFVNLDDGRGTQIARAPLINPTTGKEFDSYGDTYAHREYFHGLGPVTPDLRQDEIEPIRQPQLVAPFSGTHGEPVVVFSVPIFPPDASDGRPIGVLGMAVQVFDITGLDANLGENQLLTIAHTNLDFFVKPNTRYGLIMQHEHFHRAARAGAASSGELPLYHPVWLIQEVIEEINGHDEEPFLMENYHDALAETDPEYSGEWLAAIAPVRFAGRNGKLTGWCVLLQERP
ncbi:Serine/threonine-protein kinase PknD [Pseudobythopirellula maris]|uniref:Serine/threonine-protein kinase PknD n=1 Tax=Pseudobythopirellula maris TaxID=2527991 RepID=A0A5C5ZWS5_9BACT|nr:serine/threonine-protein kinase [Pseudobythopirellula maris]TWT90753.1 Serine/threonine-protein kinase PknD [Pseudobythopirellula maris]